MSLNLVNLDERTRSLMIEEIDLDIAEGRLYIGKRLSPEGQQDYPALLRQAALSQDDSWLASQLRAPGMMNAQEPRGAGFAKVPVTAPDTLSEGEFNRFYIRAVCRRAEQDNIVNVTVYRAKSVENPRSESQRKIGSSISAQTLLNDLRLSIGVDTAFGLPAGPNSGLSVKLP